MVNNRLSSALIVLQDKALLIKLPQLTPHAVFLKGIANDGQTVLCLYKQMPMS